MNKACYNERMNKDIKQLIFTTSKNLWYENGYENVNLRQIASACDIAIGNLTYYYPKKEDILMEYHDAIMKEGFIKSQKFHFENPLVGYFASEYAFLKYITEDLHINRLFCQVINVASLRERYFVAHHQLYETFMGKHDDEAAWMSSVAFCSMEFGCMQEHFFEKDFDATIEKIFLQRFLFGHAYEHLDEIVKESIDQGKIVASQLELDF